MGTFGLGRFSIRLFFVPGNFYKINFLPHTTQPVLPFPFFICAGYTITCNLQPCAGFTLDKRILLSCSIAQKQFLFMLTFSPFICLFSVLSTAAKTCFPFCSLDCVFGLLHYWFADCALKKYHIPDKNITWIWMRIYPVLLLEKHCQRANSSSLKISASQR